MPHENSKFLFFVCSLFLQNGDKAVVVVYPESKYKAEEIKTMAASGNFPDPAISALVQTVVL